MYFIVADSKHTEWSNVVLTKYIDVCNFSLPWFCIFHSHIIKKFVEIYLIQGTEDLELNDYILSFFLKYVWPNLDNHSFEIVLWIEQKLIQVFLFLFIYKF